MDTDKEKILINFGIWTNPAEGRKVYQFLINSKYSPKKIILSFMKNKMKFDSDSLGLVARRVKVFANNQQIDPQKSLKNQGIKNGTLLGVLFEPLKIFLCHCQEDKKEVRKLYNFLQDDNYEPWLDEVDLLPGNDWNEQIQTVVRESDIVLVCLSKNSVTKTGHVQKEIKLALDRADEKPENMIYVIPVKLEECDVPKRLSKWQWVNLFEPNGYEKLYLALKDTADKLNGLKIPKV